MTYYPYDKNPTKYLVFLDIDGVFTSDRVHDSVINDIKPIGPYDYYRPDGRLVSLPPQWDRFDPIAIDFMNRLDQTIHGLRFVLSTTWKDTLRCQSDIISHWVLSSFKNAGFRGIFADPWKTNPDNSDKYHRRDRAVEIRDYMLDFYPDIKDFIIFDDTDYNFNDTLKIKRWIRTDPVNGLLHKHMLNTLSLVGNWDRK